MVVAFTLVVVGAVPKIARFVVALTSGLVDVLDVVVVVVIKVVAVVVVLDVVDAAAATHAFCDVSQFLA